jgi:K+-sensing histidine kinase KdpD
VRQPLPTTTLGEFQTLSPPIHAILSPSAQKQLHIIRHLNFARNMRIETRILEGDDVAQKLVDFARRNQITQIYLARPRERMPLPWLSRNLVQKIASLARDMQIVIVSERDS